MDSQFEPKITCFLCKWCTYAGADLAGTSRLHYQPNGVNIRFLCSSRIDPQYIIYALKAGSDGVFIGGCHPGDCHYESGNYKTSRRIKLTKRMMEQLGVDPARVRLEWISASEGKKFAKVMDSFIDEIRELGNLNLSEE